MSAAKGIAWDLQPLGKITDAELARRLGCTAEAVWIARKNRGIPSLRRIRAKVAASDLADLPFGCLHDREISREFGFSVVDGDCSLPEMTFEPPKLISEKLAS